MKSIKCYFTKLPKQHGMEDPTAVIVVFPDGNCRTVFGFDAKHPDANYHPATFVGKTREELKDWFVREIQKSKAEGDVKIVFVNRAKEPTR